jgi:uncharacterized protein YxeA
MKKILAVVFILLFILPACGHKNNSKDYLSEQPVIEQADKESIDETNQNTDNQAQDSFDLEKPQE